MERDLPDLDASRQASMIRWQQADKGVSGDKCRGNGLVNR
jgi:hypothetical protein